MNVFDFDQTIYRGDTGRDFYQFVLRRYPKLWWRAPRALVAAAGFGLKILSSRQFKDNFYPAFFPYIDVEREAKAFWKERNGRIEEWYLGMKQPNDVVTTASPECLVRPITEMLGVRMIGAEVDVKTGKLTGRNNKRDEKVPNFYEQFPGAVIEKFYSDSRSDDPMAAEAKKAFLVRGKKILPWPKD